MHDLNKLLRAIFAILIFSIASTRIVAQISWPSDFYIHSFICQDQDLKYLQNTVDNWKKQPLIVRLSIADNLIQYLLSNEKSITSGYVKKVGMHDLNQYYGRAAWGIEEIFGVELQKVNNPSAEALENLHSQGLQKMSLYKNSIAIMQSKDETDTLITRLKEKYYGKINRSQEHIDESAERMKKLLTEWFPVGKKIDQLEKITGFKGMLYSKDGEALFWTGNETATVYLYNFDGGYGGEAFVFIIEDSIITSVLLKSID